MNLARRSLASASLATTLLAGLEPAAACHEDEAPAPGYLESTNVGIFLGLTFAPRVRFVYGLDVRLGSGQLGGVLRLEGHGASHAKLTVALAAVNATSSGGFHGELGAAFRGGHERFGRSLAPHVAAGISDSGLNLGLRLFATIPVDRAHADYDLGLTPWLAFPGNLCLGGGRPLRAGEDAVLPSAWCLGAARSLDEQARLAYWTEAARTEASSVPSFVRLAAELRQVGAPRALVDAALAAAGDEARHAHVCAAHAGGVVIGAPPAALSAPRPAASATAALARIGVEAWREGCVGEGIAATEVPIAAIARDEARHAELGWQLLGWAWQQGGAAVRDAIVAELEATVIAHDVTERARARARRQLAA